MRMRTLTHAAVVLASLALALTGCRRTPDGYEVDPDVEARAAEAAEKAQREAQEAAGRLEKEARRAGERLEKEAGAAAERLQEEAGEAAEKVGDEAVELGEKLRDEAAETAARVRPELERRVDDAAITARVKAKLVADPEVRTFDIDVDTVGGVVTLHGVVQNAAAKAEAEKHARQTEGVRQVVNLVRVGGEPAAPQPER